MTTIQFLLERKKDQLALIQLEIDKQQRIIQGLEQVQLHETLIQFPSNFKN